MFLALCLHELSQGPKHLWSLKMQATCDGCLTLRSVQINTSTEVFLQELSQAHEHFKSLRMKAACGGCFPLQFICSVIYNDYSMFRSVHPQGSSKVVLNIVTYHHTVLPISLSLFAASLMNLWGWLHVWSDCHPLRQYQLKIFKPDENRPCRIFLFFFFFFLSKKLIFLFS